MHKEDQNKKYNEGSILTFCDNLEAVKVSNKNNTVVKMKKKQNDLIRAIQKASQRLQLKYTSNMYTDIKIDITSYCNQALKQD